MTAHEITVEWEKRMPKRPEAESLPSLKLLGPAYGGWGKSCPTLAGWLCDTVYDDGGVKGEVTLSLKRKGSEVEALLKVEDGALCMRARADTPDDVLAALELLLVTDRPPWEADSHPLGQWKKKGKKGG